MDLAYLQGTSLIDYPGKVAAVVWTVGCNLRCPFCYNAELVLPELVRALPKLPPEEVLARLRERTGFLDGLVVTGGEPTLHPDLPDFLREVKALGLKVKLDTNGTHPDVVARLLAEQLVDDVALDVKAPFERYGEYIVASGLVPDATDAVRESIALVCAHARSYEFRTTVAPGLTGEDLLAIAREIRGARGYVLQRFFVPRGKRLVDEGWRTRSALTGEELKIVAEKISRLVPCTVRA
ncbi:MAG: anaerobic ribonucleoside-triphosphate reductase activating protein [Candidatus Acetothermia bacterium]|jgi:pyruvate formate lyase activating enzyme|nr:anaerobic ribonucleoside-triphosphate reductase activating protein [Candidatus Acetothermia bacterium]